MAKKAARSNVAEYPTQEIFVACDAVSRDTASRKASLYGLFDAVRMEKLDQVTNFSVYLRLHGGRGSLPLAIQIIDPDGNPLEGGPNPVDVALQANGNVELHAMVVGLKFKKFGTHQIRATLGKRVLGPPVRIEVQRVKKEK